MPALCESADEPPRFSQDVTFKVGQRFFSTLALGLPLEQENSQRPEQGKVARCGGLTHRASIFVLRAVAAVVLPVFDAPVAAAQLLQAIWTGLLGPIRSHRKASIVGFFDHFASAHDLGVAVDAHDLSHAGQAHRLGVGGYTPKLPGFNASVLLVHCRSLRGEGRRAAVARLWPPP